MTPNEMRILALKDELAQLSAENEALKTDKANLERTIEEMNEALEENGISIDCDGNVTDTGKEQAVKDTAKDILQMCLNVHPQGQSYRFPEMVIAGKIREKYGVEVENDKV